MRLRDIPSMLADDPAIISVLGKRDAVLAVPEPARAVTVAALAQLGERRPMVVAVPTTTDADRLTNDLRMFLGHDEVEAFPAWETLPFERVSPGVETMGNRLRVLWHLRDPERCPSVIVAPIRALIQRLGPGHDDIDPIVIGHGDVLDQTQLTADLVAMGYRREYQVEHRGEFTVRGSIVDVFPSTSDVPFRIDLWGDEVERLTEFGVGDQRSTTSISEIALFPARELVLDDTIRERAELLMASEPWGRDQWERLSEGDLFDGMESWLPWLVERDEVLFDVIGPDGIVMLVEPRRLRDRAADILAEEADLARTLARTWGAVPDDDPSGEATADLPRLHLPFDRLLTGCDAPAWTLPLTPDGPKTPGITASGWDPVIGDGTSAAQRLTSLLDRGYSVTVGADTTGSGARLTTLLSDQGADLLFDDGHDADLTAPGGRITVAPLERGFVMPGSELAVLTEAEVTGRRRAHRKARRRKRDAQAFFDDLKVGDHVVHQQHGVAKFAGMVKRAIGGVERDYLLLEYRGNDKLYIPTEQIDTVRHYTGGDSPSLSRLNGAEWQKTKAKVQSAVEEIAQELVVLYQTRISTPGHVFAEDTPWQRDLEGSFPFQETPDQLEAVAAIKSDMEQLAPMDRLVVGDVGFGKTEVALRAAFKAVQEGKQVAILVPTTLLASQHYQTFTERMAGFPVRVEVLSRFLTNAQAKKVTQGIADGDVDLVIGTHRLLSADIKFKDLGLLVVDEEQRFGVSHKESIKQLRSNVDVLTLTATPIPRTLEMSLTGIRDLSLLNTPPADRQPILTYVGEYDERAVAESIRRELLREGQVFFVHNRVMDIEHVAASLRDLVPEARVAVAHGQMDEGSLERVVIDFWEGEYDVLVCTTIIESGIDMPSVNTLVVDRADLLGLGQLHQLRGRVGRAGQRAYAYLFTPPDKVLSEEAYERLKTIGEATELGSGFKIAMRDLEIRGAGNMLGTGQSGHIAAVGYDLYCQMVTEAVSELKGEKPPESIEITIDLPVPAFLPDDYVSREEHRLEAYRRLAAVTTSEQVADIETEWQDRYGPLPQPAEALLEAAQLRAAAHTYGIRDITVTKGPGFGGPAFVARVSPVELPTSKQIRIDRLYGESVYKPDSQLLSLAFKKKSDLVSQLLGAIADLVPLPEQAPVEDSDQTRANSEVPQQ